ncbi:hypothetical protein [Desulfitobacterium hafniense]|uniref:Uncharacterized protein n=4 Tax=root TaxID=1 RepID=A0A098AZQ1_DESHA|nr:hypothetical protein [Desulfitobacterium hafniense]ACL21213.1 hypothetical protein Dhaf_3192 [Desulfitobacterium hafniense DCB-2]EHL06590.1 hypothetical protein HMPREF0322_02639 [Desulfitobacterium hafniense DP7]KTE91419.1 hypothetical protein AT727_22550 [Desulfitobacterium hafniense]MEA5024901.1 hypothetical protein [Desulfitobacterium hafniense]CDX02114.1 Hypothetical protein DPCES_2227 [Desulfitobacterium hafniense]
MDKELSAQEADREKVLDALMEYAAKCYMDYMLARVDEEKEKFYQEHTFPAELDVRMEKFFREFDP